MALVQFQLLVVELLLQLRQALFRLRLQVFQLLLVRLGLLRTETPFLRNKLLLLIYLVFELQLHGLNLLLELLLDLLEVPHDEHLALQLLLD